jgi:hypothetical protein
LVKSSSGYVGFSSFSAPNIEHHSFPLFLLPLRRIRSASSVRIFHVICQELSHCICATIQAEKSWLASQCCS